MKTDSPFYHALQKPQRTHSVFPAVAKTALVAVLSAAVLAGCAVGPDYVIPETDVPVAYKEDSLWKTAKPADEYPRGQWWSVFRDPELDRLMERLNSQNLTIAQAEAQYRQAQALMRQAESALFPTLSLDAGRTRGALSNSSSAISTQNQAIGTLSWEVDLWGGIRRNVEAGEAGAQASLAQLAAVRLSQQAQLATAYLELIVTDRQISRLEESEKLLAESLKLTQNQYNAGIVSDADVAQAESQLKVAQAATIDSKLARTQLEHAIAVSIGVPPATFPGGSRKRSVSAANPGRSAVHPAPAAARHRFGRTQGRTGKCPDRRRQIGVLSFPDPVGHRGLARPVLRRPFHRAEPHLVDRPRDRPVDFRCRTAQRPDGRSHRRV